ncbi:MAG: FGGY-family carbohydrate kinase [Oscillospiraceae bacterium]|nr:FGGY-family carbohydrate kinase [Oscillospiraceae bacterium]
MEQSAVKAAIESGKTWLGIELGSTRIKSVLIGPDYAPIASGDFVWENRYENGVWTYALDDVWFGLQNCYADLRKNVREKYGVSLTSVDAIGISAMMHGYLPFNSQDELLTPFRTWRNTMTGQAAAELTSLLGFNIPQRWSLAHLYQAILNGESHVNEIAFLTTLSGYVHWKLTGRKVLGVGDAAGMFPIDSETNSFHSDMLEQFQSAAEQHGWTGNVRDILPTVLTAGADAGSLTEEGARLLDISGELKPGIPFAPPEGDAGTGMAATNSVAVHTGNVSAGTSIFSMVVLERQLSQVYEEIDMVTTPAGRPVAMVHCNNCTNEINAWAEVFRGFLAAIGQEPDMNQIFTTMFTAAGAAEKDCGGLLLYNYLSGEPLTGFSEGRPLLVRDPECRLTFANFMRVQLYSAVATLKLGMKILDKEQVKIRKIFGHGGFFKTPEIGQKMMAAALNTPVSVMETAGEGGAWGMALLAAYLGEKTAGQTLEDYLENRVFAGQNAVTLPPDPADRAGFDAFMKKYEKGLVVERTAVQTV